MKKITIIYLIIVMLMIYRTSIYSVSNNLYSIELADGISEIAQNYFADSEGNTLNITINELSSTEGFAYTDKNLETIISKANNTSIDSLKEELRQQIKEKFGDSLSEEYIQQYLDSIKINGVLRKGIEEISKNTYKCFYYRTKWSVGEDYSYLADTYQLVSGKTLYTLTVSGTEEFLSSIKVNRMLESFTITNFEPIEEENFWESILEAGFSGMLEAIILIAITGGVGTIFGRKKKSKKMDNSKEYVDKTLEQTDYIDAKDNNEKSIRESLSFENDTTIPKQSNMTHSEDVKLIEDIDRQTIYDIKEKEISQYCDECGERLEKDWIFCNNCGTKVLK